MAVYEKKCVICGKEFSTKYFNQKVCSVKCRTRLKADNSARCYAKKTKQPRTAVCPICGKQFTVLQGRMTMYCSDECRNIAKRRCLTKAYRKRVGFAKKVDGQHECPICGKLFNAGESWALKIGNRYVCSWKCLRELKDDELLKAPLREADDTTKDITCGECEWRGYTDYSMICRKKRIEVAPYNFCGFGALEVIE